MQNVSLRYTHVLFETLRIHSVLRIGDRNQREVICSFTHVSAFDQHALASVFLEKDLLRCREEYVSAPTCLIMKAESRRGRKKQPNCLLISSSQLKASSLIIYSQC